MILEKARLDVKPGETAQFEAAFAQAAQHQRVARWRRLEDHTEGFRKSEPYQRWKALLHLFYDPFPVVEHYTAVFQGGDHA